MPTVEDAAEAAYLAGMELRTDKTMRPHPWATLPEHWKRIYRAQATAVIALCAPELALFELEGNTP